MQIRYFLLILVSLVLLKSCKSKCLCNDESNLLLDAISEYKSIFTDHEIYKIKNLHSDSLFGVDIKYLNIFRKRYDEDVDSVSSIYRYFKAKNYNNVIALKWEYLSSATQRYENNMCLNDKEILNDVFRKMSPNNFYVLQIKKANSANALNLKQNCICENESNNLKKAIDEYKSLLSKEQINELRKLPLDSLYKIDSFTMKKYLALFNEELDRKTSFYLYFKQHNFDEGLDWKWDFISVATNRNINQKCLNIAEIFYEMKYKSYVKYRNYKGIIENF